MRLQFATMTLAIAILSRQIRVRSVSAFQISSSSQLLHRSLTSSTTTSATTTTDNATRRSRRNRPVHSSDSLHNMIQEMERNKGKKAMTLSMSAVEADKLTVNGEEAGDDLSNIFPQKGKDILDCAPRMRFAPSPTGR